MRTSILAYVIALMGFIMMGAGSWGLLIVVGAPARPLRDYALTIAMISGGLAMLGLAQALRLLILIFGHG
jgi:hypothetical protein